MDSQMTFNAVLAISSSIIGWYLNAVWRSVKELQDTDNKLADKVQAIEILVAGTYLKREEVHGMMEALFKKLDKIEDKLDRKADKI